MSGMLSSIPCLLLAACYLLLSPGVMAGGDHIRAVFQTRFEEQLELHLLIAHHIRIGRAAGLVFGDHVIDNFLAILRLEIVHFERDAEVDGHG